jgi:probable rRNA maturation factor
MKRRVRRPAAAPTVDVIVQSPRWNRRPRVASLVRRAIAAAAPRAARRCELSVVLADDKAVRALNRKWRKKNAATNVLSFPVPDGGASPSPVLGDIVIAYETTATESRAEGKRFDHHLVHLVVHGFLHLLGYDHESDAEADEMEHLERKILARLDVPNPYAARDAGTDA